MSRSKRLWGTLCFIVPLLGCSSSNARYVSPFSTKWVKQQIRAYEMPTNEGVSQVIRKAIYGGNSAYLIPSPCCDKFDYFYDSRGVILCAPSGGFTGRGDGSCSEVFGTGSAKDL